MSTTWTVSLKQVAIALLLTATLAGCGSSNRGTFHFGNDGGDANGSDDGGSSGDNGDNGGGDVGDGGGDSGSGDGDGSDGGDGGGSGGGGGGGDKPSAAIGGTVVGLKSPVVLRINDKIQLELVTDGTFSVGTELTIGSPYLVTVISQPSFPAQDCKIANGTGTIAGDVTDVLVTCADLDVATLQTEPGPGHAILKWTAPSDATHFNVYFSSVRDCDIANYSSCPDGALLADVTSPLKVRQLRDAQAYFFRVETVHTNGARGLSNEAGARPDQLRVQGYVAALERTANGTVYIGGQFDGIGLAAGAAAPLDQQTGRLAQPDFAIVSADGQVEVRAVASDGAGGWYIGGWFSHVGGVPRQNLAHVFADGKVDPSFDPSPDAEVQALAVFAGRVYVGGYFTTIAAQPRAGLVAFDAHDGGRLLDWNLHAPGNAYAFAVHEDALYIGGDFVSPQQGKQFGRLAAVDATGALLKNWRPTPNGAVTALAVSNDTVYAAGDFTAVSGHPYNGIVAIGRQSGQAMSSWTPQLNSWVTALAASGDTLYVGGNFTFVNGQSRPRLASIDATGQLTAWNPPFGGGVDALAIAGDTVYVGGMSSGLRAIGTDGTLLSSWQPNVMIRSVLALAVADDTVYAGGWGGMMIGTGRRNLAAIDSDGALLAWHPQVNNAIHAMASDGQTLYIGGDFSKIDDVSRVRLAAFEADGTLASWSPQANKTVAALAVSDGTVYAGGDFDSITTVDAGTAPRSRLAAIDPQGQVTDWDPHVNGIGKIDALAAADGVVFAGGGFEGIGHDPIVGVRNFAAIDASSARHLDGWEHRFLGGSVHALRIHDDVIYIGGEFTRRDDLPFSPPYLDGISLLTGQPLFWDPRVNAPVWAFDSVAHLLYFGGEFTQAGGQQRGGLAALKTPNGTISLSEWAPPGKKNLSAIAAGADFIYAGGSLSPGAPNIGIEDIGVAIIEAASSNGTPALH